MKTSELIELLQKLDPSGQLPVFSIAENNAPEPFVAWVDRKEKPLKMTHLATTDTAIKSVLL